MSRTALITGATSEIGQSIVAGFVQSGLRCAISARRSDRLEDIAQKYRHVGTGVVPIAADMAIDEDRRLVVDKTRAELGGPDVLVYVAARSAIKPILEFPDEDWQRGFAVNVDGAPLRWPSSSLPACASAVGVGAS